MSDAANRQALENAFREQSVNRNPPPQPRQPPIRLNNGGQGPIPRVVRNPPLINSPVRPPLNLGGLLGGLGGLLLGELIFAPPAGDPLGDAGAGERRRNGGIAPPRQSPEQRGTVPFRGGQDPNRSYFFIVDYFEVNANNTTIIGQGMGSAQGPIDIFVAKRDTGTQAGIPPKQVNALEVTVTGGNDFVRVFGGVLDLDTFVRVQITNIQLFPSPAGDLDLDPPLRGAFAGGSTTFSPPPPLSFDSGTGTSTGTTGFGIKPPPLEREPVRIPPPIGEPQDPPPPPTPIEIPPPTRTPTPTPIPNETQRPVPDRRVPPPLPITTPPPPIVSPDIQPIPTPFPPPTRDPDRVPFPPPTGQPTEQPPQLPPRDPAIEQILQTQLQQSDLLQQIPFLIPTILGNSQTFQDSVRSRVTESVCQQSQPDGCIANAAENAATGVKNKVDASDAANAAGFAAILAKLVTMFDWIKAAFNNTIVDKAVAYMTLITSIHNAAMLSTSIKDTLGEALSLGLATVGIKTPEGSPIDINEAVNKSAENLIKGVIGDSNYLTLSVNWAKASRIWQSGAAIIYNVRSLWDSARSLNELTGNNVGKIGNALRKDGMVSENAYKNMSENNVQVNVAMQRLENLDDAASTLSAITSETFGITENLVELTNQRTQFNNNVKDLAPKIQVENDPLKAKEVAEKAASVSPPIVDADLFKPDV